MNCNLVIHDELKNDGEMTCPFCNQQFQDSTIVIAKCCEEMNLIKDVAVNVCQTCVVNGYDFFIGIVTFMKICIE